MKKLLLILLLFSGALYSQQNLELTCGFTVEDGQSLVIDTLSFSCSQVLLMQPNSKITINKVVGTGELKIIYGDKYEPKFEPIIQDNDTIGWNELPLVSLAQRDSDGNEYTDYMKPDDVYGEVTFTCKPDNVVSGDYVTINWGEACYEEIDDDLILADEMLLECIIYDFNGRLIYSGVFANFFVNDCSTCIPENYNNKILLINFFKGQKTISTKRIYFR